ncbi:MAG: RNA pseudouridine synthase, partial [Clostridia bacterium]|nr:RNA pseudouridine synthase [Clostridia bacterium]
MESFSLTAKPEENKKRIDKSLSEEFPELSRSYIHKLIENKLVLANKKYISKNYKLSEGEVIEINIPDPEPYEVAPEDISLDIVYEDSDLLIVNKPKDMVVHPAPGNTSGTLVNALLYRCKDSLSGINGILRPGIVHRIDKDTSGLLIVAKNDNAHKFLAEQIKNHSFTREYQAIIIGRLKD